MQNTEIKCDHCGKDLTYTGNCEDYYLIVTNGRMRPAYEKDGERGGFLHSMIVYPPISRPHHFCDFRCFDKWREPQRELEAKHSADMKARAAASLAERESKLKEG